MICNNMNLENALKTHYDTFSAEYDGIDQGVEQIVSKLNITPGLKILDIGCGTGNLTFRLPQIDSFNRIVGIDLSEGVLNIAKNHALGLGLKNCEFLRADARQLPFGDEEFDYVVSNMVFHLIPDRRKVLSEMFRA